MDMKTSCLFRDWFLISSAVALIVGMCAASVQSQTNKLRIGVYDSRVIAIAYCDSPEFRDSLKSVHADYDKAKADKDDKHLKEIEARMKLQQRRLHEQGFSTGSVAGIMAKVKDALPGVAAIVSKWELNYQSTNTVEVVDVTDKLVALFHVSERGLKWTKDKMPPPLTMEEITDDMD